MRLLHAVIARRKPYRLFDGKQTEAHVRSHAQTSVGGAREKVKKERQLTCVIDTVNRESSPTPQISARRRIYSNKYRRMLNFLLLYALYIAHIISFKFEIYIILSTFRKNRDR